MYKDWLCQGSASDSDQYPGWSMQRSSQRKRRWSQKRAILKIIENVVLPSIKVKRRFLFSHDFFRTLAPHCAPPLTGSRPSSLYAFIPALLRYFQCNDDYRWQYWQYWWWYWWYEVLCLPRCSLLSECCWGISNKMMTIAIFVILLVIWGFCVHIHNTYTTTMMFIFMI